MNAGFFRHGPAVPRGTGGIDDPDRPLTPEGRKKTVQAARGVERLDLEFQAVFTSPLPRALETAELLAEILDLPRPRTLDLLAPGSAARRLLAELSTLKVERPLLVGHEPDLSGAVALAISGGGKVSIDLKKAGLACVDFHRTSPRPEGTLTLLLTPASLRKLGST